MNNFNQERIPKATPDEAIGAVGLICHFKKLLRIVSQPARLLECQEGGLGCQGPPASVHHHQAGAGQGSPCRSGSGPQSARHRSTPRASDPDSDTLSGVESSTSGNQEDNDSQLQSKTKPPSEIIKLVSNGAYGAVYLVKNRQTRQRLALILRNQVCEGSSVCS